MGVHRERHMETVGFVELLAAPAAKRRWTGGWKAQIALRHQASYARGILQRDHRETARKLNPALQREWAMVIARAFQAHDLRKSWSKEQYIKHSLLLGTHFDRDATLPLMRDHLLRDEPCFLRMLGLQEEMDRLMPEVLGPGFSHYSQALEQFSGLSLQQALALVAHDDPLSQVLNFYPQKANQLTADSLARMSQRCNSLAASVFEGAEMRSGAVVLFAHAFILGEGSLDDPLHDYLRRFLRSERPNKAQLLFSYGQRRARAQLREIAKFNESE